jgi:uncharacterized protein (DUF58 family)
MYTGAGPTRFEQGLLALALIAFSAERAGQRTGALFFDGGIRRVYPPRKGSRHVMTLLQNALAMEAGGRGSGLGRALSGAGRLLKRRSLVVIVSDFLALNWERELEELARKHDVIALRISDPLDRELPRSSLVPLEDPETAFRLHVPAGFASFRKAWAQWHEDRAGLWEALCKKAGAAFLELSTADKAVECLLRFFGRRKNAVRGQAAGGAL